MSHNFLEQEKAPLIPQSWEEAYGRIPSEVITTISQLVRVRVHESLELGDIHQRHQFHQQLKELQRLRMEAQRREDFEEMAQIFQVFIEIIEAPSAKYPLVTKLFTAVMCASLLSQITNFQDQWLQLYRDFEAALFKNSQEVDGKMLLFAAFKAQWQRSSQINTELAVTEYLPYIPPTEWDSHVKRHLFLSEAAKSYQSLLTTGRFSIRLPRVVIHLNEEVEQEPTIHEGGYPDGVMYLAPGSVPSTGKLDEAATYGVPHRRTGILEPRGLRLLFGVDINVEVKREFKGNVKYEPGKRFAYVYLPSMVPDKPDFVGGSRLMADLTYDALTYAEAIRLSRQLTKDWERIENDPEYTMGRWMGLGTQKEHDQRLRKIKAVEKALDSVRERVGHPKEVSGIFAANFREMKHNYAYQGTATDKYELFLQNVRAIVVRDSRKGLIVETPDKVDSLFKHHVWEHELTVDDKAELALELLAGTRRSLWLYVATLSQEDQKLVTMAVDQLQDGVSMSHMLSAELKFFLADKVKAYFKSRAETVRDTKEPRGLKQRVQAYFKGQL